MPATITRRFEFDSGHRVLGHEGKCANLHGHRYVADVTVQAPELDGLGRVVDFSEVKRILGTWIDERWDHNMLLNSQDPLIRHVHAIESDKAPAILFGPKEPCIFPGCNPTAENMVRALFNVAVNLLPSMLRVTAVRLYETPNCWADYTWDDYNDDEALPLVVR